MHKEPEDPRPLLIVTATVLMCTPSKLQMCTLADSRSKSNRELPGERHAGRGVDLWR